MARGRKPNTKMYTVNRRRRCKYNPRYRDDDISISFILCIVAIMALAVIIL
jgi:hypothetical protein